MSRRIPLNTSVVRILPDAQRTVIYAIDRVNSDILVINPQSGAIEKKLYVGMDPTDFDVDATGSYLYIANKGPGTGIPGSWRIGVVSLTNFSLVTAYITPIEAVNVSAGKPGRLFYNSGFDQFNGGDAHSLDTETGTDLGSFAGVKTRMVLTSDKTRLYGQYIYSGNLGQMGVFDISSDRITVVDSLAYSPYPYGWDYDNYSLAGNDAYLAYGRVLFNPKKLMDQIGLFPEQVYALNQDGSVAFGETTIWDTITFSIHGNATRIADMPISTTVMTFDKDAHALYAFNGSDKSIYVVEEATTHGIPFRWLRGYGLATNDVIELQDTDGDGFTTLQEWQLDSNPTNQTPALRLEWVTGSRLTVQNSSQARWYELQRTEDLAAGVWQASISLQGSGSNLVFDIGADLSQFTKGFYRLQPKIR